MDKVIRDYHQSYSEDFCKYTLYKAAMGLMKMHGQNVLHRDFKSCNILCSDDGEVKIADIGLSVLLSQQAAYRKTRKSTLNWISPEVVLGVQYSKEIDVWALGCFAYELATGTSLYHNIDRSQVINCILIDPVPPIPSRWSESFKDFIEKCLVKDAD